METLEVLKHQWILKNIIFLQFIYLLSKEEIQHPRKDIKYCNNAALDV